MSHGVNLERAPYQIVNHNSTCNHFFGHHSIDPHILVGITIRLFLMRYFKWTVSYFHKLHNPHNCQILMMKKRANGKYILAPHAYDIDLGTTPPFQRQLDLSVYDRSKHLKPL